MFLHTLRLYLRNITRRKLFSFINIAGLAFAIAFILLIGQFLFHEYSYNRSLQNVENIYRLADADENIYDIDYRIKDVLLGKTPGVNNVCLLNRNKIDVNVGDKVFQIKSMLTVDPNFFELFRIPFISGSSKDALISVDAVVLTETTAKIIFGTINAVGKTLQLNHEHTMLVTGIVKDLSPTVSFTAEVFVSFMNSPTRRLPYRMTCVTFDGKDDSQCRYPFNVFVELEKQADIGTIEKQICGFNGINTYRFPKNVKLTPLKTNYFNTEFRDTDLMHGNANLIKILSIIGIIILLLAVINFVNLATAAYRYRMKEIGVKKCLGVSRLTLIQQLLMESLLTCIISSLLGIILAELLLPSFDRFVDTHLSLQIFSNPMFFTLFVSFIVLLSLLAGLLPAFVLSRISPIQLFKLNPYLKGAGKRFRGVLTVFQFSITIILICGLIAITKQIDFVKHKDLGFNTDHLLYLNVHNTLQGRIQNLTDKLQQFHSVKSITQTMGVPGNINLRMNNYQVIIIDSTSLRTFGFKILQGRDLLPSDANKACLINMASLKIFPDGDFHNTKVNGNEIVGVVSNFHYSSLHNEIGPLVLLNNPSWGVSTITMRISGSIGEIVEYVKKTWNEVYSDYPIEFGFYDEHFASMYRKEENLASLVSIFSVLAVVISCMGIFGLSVFQSEQRIKEIGIRKVLGATTGEITLLLSRSFSMWVVYAAVIAFPIAYYFLDKWLQDFAYRIDIQWWMFALAGGIAFMVALLTISIQAIKSAIADPVKSLRYE